MEFVAFIGKDEENWGQVAALLNRLEYEKAYLIVSSGIAGFPSNDKCKILEVGNQGMLELKKELNEKLKKELSGDFEVSLSLASGNGKEHMALLSALLTIPVGIRLVVYTKNGIEFIT